MSRLGLPQEACRVARQATGSSSRLVAARGIATASADYSNRDTRSQGPKKRLAKEAKKKDDKLRHAINIYQMANFFFPTKAAEDEASPISSASLLGPLSSQKRNSARKETADADRKDELDETLDDHIRGTLMGSSQHQIFDNQVHMQTANAFLQAKVAQDRSQFASVYQSNSPNADPDWNQLFPQSGPPASRPVIELSGDEASSPLPPVEDREAVEKYIAETVKRAATARALNERTLATNVDVRGAQVMDALYGTVGGHFPGLEVIRERVKEMEDRERHQQEAGKRQDESS